MRLDGEKATFIVLLAVVGFLTIIPLAFVVFSSFWSVSPGVAGHLTFLNYLEAYSNPLTYHAILNTFVYSLGATSEAAAIGIPFSWFVSRTNTPFARFLEYVSIIPYMIPGILYAIAWVFLLNPNNGAILLPITHAFGLRNIPFSIYSLGGMIFVDGLTGVPLIVIFLSAAFKNQDSTLEDSAAIIGSGKFQILRSITLPLVLPAILAAISLNILRYFELFEVPAVIGLPGGVYVLSTLIYGQISGIIPNFGYATVLGITAIMVSLLLVYVYRRSTMRANRFATITGKGRRLDKIDLGRWKYFSFAFCLIVFLVSTVLPTTSLILGAILPYWGILSTESLTKALSQASLNHFYFAFSLGIVRRAFVNSFIVSILGATIGMVLALFIGHILAKSNIRGKSVLEQLSFAPFAIPGIVMGLGLLSAYTFLPIPVIGTIWVLLLAYLTKFMPYGIRSMTSNLVQVHKELEESSRVAGSSWIGTIRKVIVPLVRSGFVGGWILLFIIFMREVSSSILLYRYGSEVLSVVVYALLTDIQWEAASAIGVVMVAIILIASFIAYRVAESETVGVA